MSDKCKVIGNKLTPCKHLQSAIQHGNPSSISRGIYIPSRVNLTTGEPGTDIVQIHSGDHSVRGVAANFCPFCGTAINTWDAPESAVKVNHEN